MKKKFMERNVWLIIFIILVVAFFIFFSIAYFKSTKINSNHSGSENDLNLAPSEQAQNYSEANPASQNCATVGGNLEIKKNGAGGEYGLCYFEDNRACEEWALFRGECPIGGIKTTGFDTEAQSYCAWLGGETLAVDNAVCKFKDGSSCLDTDLYSDLCHKGEEK